MEYNLRLIKRFTKHKLENDFDEKYDFVRKIALEEYNYTGDIKIIKDNKWVSFYMLYQEVD